MPLSSLFLMLSLQAATATGMGAVQPPPAWLKRFDVFIAEQMREQDVPGIALAIIKDGVVLAAKGYGEANVEHHVPVTAETIFQSGSIGKQFTAAAIMMMVEEGRLSLDDSITKYLLDAPTSWKPITVRHLLTNTSGIAEYAVDAREWSADRLDTVLAHERAHVSSRDGLWSWLAQFHAGIRVERHR